jgi:hypothetical protein
MDAAVIVMYSLVDPDSGATVAQFPALHFRSATGAHRAASLQARRHAAAGRPMLLQGMGIVRLYVPKDSRPIPALREAASRVAAARAPRTPRRRRDRSSPKQLELPLDMPVVEVPRRP